MSGEIVQIALEQLRAHPLNSNVMAEELVEKLAGHIGRSGRYPALVVRPVRARDAQGDPDAPSPGSGTRRPLPGGEVGPGAMCYEVLDGHHRWKALAKLGRTHANCVVWDVDDAEALLLLSTLNRLQGRDDPRKRARLMGELRERLGVSEAELARRLPENREQVRKLLEIGGEKGPMVRVARPMGEMPTVVHFFLSGEQRDLLEASLEAIGGGREAALMRLVERGEED